MNNNTKTNNKNKNMHGVLMSKVDDHYCSSNKGKNKNDNDNDNNSYDPWARALITIQFGLIVHFGTMWMLRQQQHQQQQQQDALLSAFLVDTAHLSSTATQKSPWNWLRVCLILHEYWVYLQHWNVLSNPYCQRLDRQYGIALLKNNQHWSIAGTLSAYWCRESLSMFFALPFVMAHQNSNSDSYSCYLVLYSLLYHTIKSYGIRKDAIRRYSTTLGIMRIVIDNFYTTTVLEQFVSLLRLFLQGFDTYIHYVILTGLLRVAQDGVPVVGKNDNNNAIMIIMIHMVFTIWVFHAAMNQYFRCSTASLMVQAWKILTQTRSTSSNSNISTSNITGSSSNKKNDNADAADDDDDVTATETETESEDSFSIIIDDNNNDNINGITNTNDEDINHDKKTTMTTITTNKTTVDVDVEKNNKRKNDKNDKYIVRSLLHPGRVTDTTLIGKHGTGHAASNGVDKAVTIETILAVLATLYIIGLNDVPFKIINMNIMNDNNNCNSSSIGRGFNVQNMMMLLGAGSNSNSDGDGDNDNDNDNGSVIFVIQYVWILYSILHSISKVVFFNKKTKQTNNRSKIILGSKDTNQQYQEKIRSRSRSSRIALLFNTLDVAMAVTMISSCNDFEKKNNNNNITTSMFLGAAITVQSFVRSSSPSSSNNKRTDDTDYWRRLLDKVLSYTMNTLIFLVRIYLARSIMTNSSSASSFNKDYKRQQQEYTVSLVGAVTCMFWSFLVLFVYSTVDDNDGDNLLLENNNTKQPSITASFTTTTTSSSSSSTASTNGAAPDVVFLGHPGELSDLWAMWSLPYVLDKRWKMQPKILAIILWPFHYLVGHYICNYRRRLFGDGYSFFKCDESLYRSDSNNKNSFDENSYNDHDNYYGIRSIDNDTGTIIRMQTWTSPHFGRHFVTHPRSVQKNIESSARYADTIGVRILCLGALNKAERINGGGIGLVHALGSNRQVSIVHGNHLTAAAVVETTKQCFGDGKNSTTNGESTRVFLTGM